MTRLAFVALLVAVATGDARADDPALARARAAIDQLDYAGAQGELEAALRTGKHGPEQLAEVYRLTGIVEASLGNTKDAAAAFERLLSIAPKATLPAGTSPKIAKPFAAAEAKVKKRGALTVKQETASDPPAITLVIENDPLGLVVRARAAFVVDKGKEQVLEAAGDDRITIELPNGGRIDVRMVALDEYGNRIVELGSKDVPIVITGTAQTTKVTKDDGKPVVRKDVKPRAPRSWYFKWWLWGGVAVAALGGATYFGTEARSGAKELDVLFEDSLNHQVGESTRLESRVRRDVLLTNIAFGTAGVLAIGAAILYLTEPRQEAQSNTLTVVPVDSGGALVVGGRF